MAAAQGALEISVSQGAHGPGLRRTRKFNRADLRVHRGASKPLASARSGSQPISASRNGAPSARDRAAGVIGRYIHASKKLAQQSRTGGEQPTTNLVISLERPWKRKRLAGFENFRPPARRPAAMEKDRGKGGPRHAHSAFLHADDRGNPAHAPCGFRTAPQRDRHA